MSHIPPDTSWYNSALARIDRSATRTHVLTSSDILCEMSGQRWGNSRFLNWVHKKKVFRFWRQEGINTFYFFAQTIIFANFWAAEREILTSLILKAKFWASYICLSPAQGGIINIPRNAIPNLLLILPISPVTRGFCTKFLFGFCCLLS